MRFLVRFMLFFMEIILPSGHKPCAVISRAASCDFMSLVIGDCPIQEKKDKKTDSAYKKKLMKWPFNLKKVKIIKQDMHNNSKTIKINSRNHASNEFIQRNKLQEVYSNNWSQYRPRVSPKKFLNIFFYCIQTQVL